MQDLNPRHLMYIPYPYPLHHHSLFCASLVKKPITNPTPGRRVNCIQGGKIPQTTHKITRFLGATLKLTGLGSWLTLHGVDHYTIESKRFLKQCF